MKHILVFGLIAALFIGSFSCASWNQKQKGAVIGGATGGAIGAVIGNRAGNTAVGAILGAVVGGAAGAYIGNKMDKQAAEMEKDLEGASVERVGEGINVTFDSGLLFDIDKAILTAASRASLTKLAESLNTYPDTEVLLEGHTDATGTDEHNMELSQRRAESVADYLESLDVGANRLIVKWYGETQPVADNETVEGRKLNRRVEVAIYANEDLKKEAQSQTQ